MPADADRSAKGFEVVNASSVKNLPAWIRFLNIEAARVVVLLPVGGLDGAEALSVADFCQQQKSTTINVMSWRDVLGRKESEESTSCVTDAFSTSTLKNVLADIFAVKNGKQRNDCERIGNKHWGKKYTEIFLILEKVAEDEKNKNLERALFNKNEEIMIIKIDDMGEGGSIDAWKEQLGGETSINNLKKLFDDMCAKIPLKS